MVRKSASRGSQIINFSGCESSPLKCQGTCYLAVTKRELLKVDTLETARGKLKEAVGENWIKAKKVSLKEALDQVLAEDIKEAIVQAKEKSNIVVVSGGSSKGKKDMTALLIDELTTPGVFTHGLALKPGKPTILGVNEDDKTLMVELPGYPVS